MEILCLSTPFDHLFFVYISLFKLGYNTLKATGLHGSIYTEKPHKNIKQDLIACKMYSS